MKVETHALSSTAVSSLRIRWGSHRCLPLSVDFFLLSLHLAEAVKTTETGESELGHALGRWGNAHQKSVGKGRVEKWEKSKREKQAAVIILRTLRSP